MWSCILIPMYSRRRNFVRLPDRRGTVAARAGLDTGLCTIRCRGNIPMIHYRALRPLSTESLAYPPRAGSTRIRLNTHV